LAFGGKRERLWDSHSGVSRFDFIILRGVRLNAVTAPSSRYDHLACHGM
jgi:hypothetical protein